MLFRDLETAPTPRTAPDAWHFDVLDTVLGLRGMSALKLEPRAAFSRVVVEYGWRGLAREAGSWCAERSERHDYMDTMRLVNWFLYVVSSTSDELTVVSV